jgi:fluoroquinolone transport system ATP-binding protein
MIHVDALTYSYPGAQAPAVRSASFDVAPGEIFGLLGPSGAGKSTIQRVLTRQNRRYQGTVAVLSQDLAAWDHGYFEKIGVTFELPNHYLKLTAKENLEFFGSLYRCETRTPESLLEMVGLKDAADVRVEEFSKGMKMRLNFVRAFLHDPSVIFFDEPTSGLDPVNAGVLKALIRDEQAKGKTILMTTHNMHDVDELCDRVGFIVDGVMSEVESPDALKARHGRRKLRIEYAVNGGPQKCCEFALDGLSGNAAFQSVLQSAEVHTIHSQEASLDQVFAEVTGVRLDAGED